MKMLRPHGILVILLAGQSYAGMRLTPLFMSLFKNAQFSGSLREEFKPEDIKHYGINGDILCMFYDPVQSLFIVGTSVGSIRLLGGNATSRTYKTKSGNPIVYVRLVKTVFLCAVDSENFLTVWDISEPTENGPWCTYQNVSSIIYSYCDPALDWIFFAQRNGQVTQFDLDRGIIGRAPIPNIQVQLNPTARMGHPLSVELHPKDLSQVLICYSQIFAVYKITENQVMFSGESSAPLKFAKWNPTGSHIVTASTQALEFWDGYEGKYLGSRPVDANNVWWGCTANPEETFLLYSSGSTFNCLDFGVNPTYSVTSWDAFSAHFTSPEAQKLNFNSNVSEICPMPAHPYLGGCANPQAVVIRLEDSTLHCVSAPKVQPLLDSTVLPEALSWNSAKVTCTSIATIPRTLWSGIMLATHHTITHGGVVCQDVRRFPTSSVVINGYEDGTIRMFDERTSGESRVVETTVNFKGPVPITHTSLNDSATELAVGTSTGNVYLMGLQKNDFGMSGLSLRAMDESIVSVADRADRRISEGFLPQWCVKAKSDEIPSALCQSSLDFVAIGYNSGRLIVIDKRGPAIIFETRFPKEHATKITFGIQEFQNDGFSSILMSVGTNKGNVSLYKVLPGPQRGGFHLEQANQYSVSKGPITVLQHLDLEKGKPAPANREVMSQLGHGIKIPGGLLAANSDDVRIFGVSGTKSKIGHKSLSRSVGSGFAFIREGNALGFINITSKGTGVVYSIPNLSSLFDFKTPYLPSGDPVQVSLKGNVLVPINPKISGLFRVWGIGQLLPEDQMYRPELKMPLRPTIGNVEWVAGRQHVKIEDFDKLMTLNKRSKPKKKRELFVNQEVVASPKKGLKKKGWFGRAHPHPGYSESRTQSSTWAQTFESYYDSAAETVNGALDDAMDSINDTKKEATSNITKGLVRKKFGF